MSIPLELGARMWRDLDRTFEFVAAENGFTGREQKAQIYAGFLAAASGAMLRDLGVGDTNTILDGVIVAVNSARAKPVLTSVKNSPTQERK